MGKGVVRAHSQATKGTVHIHIQIAAFHAPGVPALVQGHDPHGKAVLHGIASGRAGLHTAVSSHGLQARAGRSSQRSTLGHSGIGGHLGSPGHLRHTSHGSNAGSGFQSGYGTPGTHLIGVKSVSPEYLPRLASVRNRGEVGSQRAKLTRKAGQGTTDIGCLGNRSSRLPI